MKEYNHKTKKWEEKEKTGSLKKRDTCKGGKEHQFVLLVPKGTHTSHYLSKEEVKAYYRIEDDRNRHNMLCDDDLLRLGIRTFSWRRGNYRFYTCSVCKKEKYEYEKDN